MLQRTLLARLFDLKPFILLYNLFEIIVDYTATLAIYVF